MGGFVNIITRSGANDLRGSLYYFGVNDALNARSILNTPEQTLCGSINSARRSAGRSNETARSTS